MRRVRAVLWKELHVGRADPKALPSFTPMVFEPVGDRAIRDMRREHGKFESGELELDSTLVEPAQLLLYLLWGLSCMQVEVVSWN
jgi:hypothetical protein